MKIVYVNKYFYKKGGSESVFFDEREQMQRRGIKIIDFSMQNTLNYDSPYKKYFIKNIDYGLKKKNPFTFFGNTLSFIYSIESVKNMKQLINLEKPQIAHLHNIYHQLTPAIIKVLSKHGIKVIMTLHDGKIICPAYNMLNKAQPCHICNGSNFYHPIIENCQNNLANCILLSLESYFHRFAKSYSYVDQFIVPSMFYYNLFHKKCKLNNINIIHNGIDLDKYNSTTSDTIFDYALYFGRISTEKGLNTLIDAYKKIQKDKVLKIVGDGPLLDEIRNGCNDSKIKFLGRKDHSELINIISNAAFVIAPSECYENCSMTILESMALGKPVIATSIGGNLELVIHKKTGLLFQPGNKKQLLEQINFMWDNPDQAYEIGKNARFHIQNGYSLKDHCDKLFNLYKSIP